MTSTSPTLALKGRPMVDLYSTFALYAAGVGAYAKQSHEQKSQKSHSDRGSVFVGRTRVRRNCWMTGHQWWPTRRCTATADSSARVCCRETHCSAGCMSPSTCDDRPTSSCRRLRSRRTCPESSRCSRATCTCCTYLPHVARHTYIIIT